MKTITLKTDDTFFEHVSEFAKSLNLTKSELIRRAISEYEIHMQRKSLKKKIRMASFKVRQANDETIKEFDSLSNDGLSNV